MNSRYVVGAWAVALAGLFLSPYGGRDMRTSVLSIALLVFCALGLRPWLALFSVVVLASWVTGPRLDAFGWTAVLMTVVGAFAVNLAAGQRERILSALPYLLPVFVVWWLLDRYNGHSGSGALDNIIIAGPIHALFSILLLPTNPLAAAGYAFMAWAMTSSTGFLVLLVCYTPWLLSRIPRRYWYALPLGAAALSAVYVIGVDLTHIGYGQRLEVIWKTTLAGLAAPLGHGWSSFPTFSVFNLPRSWDGGAYAHAHSDLVQLLYEAGWLPVVIVAGYLGQCLWRLLRLCDLTPRQVCATGAVLGLTVFSAVGFPWHVAQSAAAGILVLANYEGEFA